MADFRRDLWRTLAAPERLARFAFDRVGPFTGVIGWLESLHAGPGEAGQAEPLLSSLSGWDDHEVQQPVTNPLRGVRRNDPCPCGKYKKCCLATV